MTAAELLTFDPDFATEEDAAKFLEWKIPTWSTSIYRHKLDCKCLSDIRFADISIQEYRELEDMHRNIRSYWKQALKEIEIRKAALKYDT